MHAYLHTDHICIYVYHAYIHMARGVSLWFDIIHFVLLHTLMGSYGDRWLQCSWCEKWGKCLDNLYLPAVNLKDVDGIGVLCDSCYERTEPVHYDYLRGLFRATFTPEIVDRIADIAYLPCYRHRCQTEWSTAFHAE